MIFTDKDFWIYASERAVKTMAQSAIAIIGIGMTPLINIDFIGLLSIAGTSALLSILTSIAGYKPSK
jgi:hypothetical protein